VALISLEPEDGADWARARGLTARTVAELAREPEVLAAIERHVSDTNARLASYESIRRHAVLPVAFTQPSSHLTPTLKVKRRAILRDFGDVVEDLYAPRR
jgi:long-chain acyl-CoA synthetase